METIPDLIEKLGPAALSSATGVSVQGISNMKQRGSIPARHWPAVIELARATDGLGNFDFETLVRLHAPATKAVRAQDRAVGA